MFQNKTRACDQTYYDAEKTANSLNVCGKGHKKSESGDVAECACNWIRFWGGERLSLEKVLGRFWGGELATGDGR